MTDCRQGKNASRYFDGELAGQDREAFEAHLAECAACRARLRDYEKLSALMGARPVAAPAPDFLGRLQARAAAARPTVWQEAARLSRLLIPVAACLCLALGAMLYIQIVQFNSAPAAHVQTADAAGDTQAESVAGVQAPLLGQGLSASEQQYLFGDSSDALVSVYAEPVSLNTDNGM